MASMVGKSTRDAQQVCAVRNAGLHLEGFAQSNDLAARYGAMRNYFFAMPDRDLTVGELVLLSELDNEFSAPVRIKLGAK